MDMASSYAFVKNKKKKASAPSRDRAERMDDGLFRIGVPGGHLDFQDQNEDEVDTNVLSINFRTLKQAEDNIQMGDASLCKGCKSCFSSISKLYTKTEYLNKYRKSEVYTDGEDKEDKEEKKEASEKVEKIDEKKVITTPITDYDKIWVCEFCEHHNVLNLEQEEIPKADDVIYLLKSAEQINKGQANLTSDITTIFCIDNSGSMSFTQEIKGKHDFKHGISAEEYEMLKQFIEEGADQFLPNQKKDTTFVTRKQCVLAAIENQLLELKADFPNRQVGLVTFNDEVALIGDGKNVPEIITGDKLYKYDVVSQMSKDMSSSLISTPVKDSAESLLKKFEKLKETGKTALGPALLASINLAIQQKQGSRVILCTDGLANIGLGEMDTPHGLEKAEQFYTDLANLAKDNGIAVSVVTIKGEGCKLDLIGKLADITSGSLIRVDPNEISNQFANIMKQEVIGTQVEVKLRLHQGMQFRNEDVSLLKEEGSLYEKNVGNITANTELTFEYEVRADEDLAKHNVDFSNLETVPFQAQIIYNSANGDRLMRVITKKVKTTKNIEEAEQHLNVNVMATRAIQHQAQFAQAGHYDVSNQIGSRWGGYFQKKQAQNAHVQQQSEALNNYSAMNYKMQSAASRQMDSKQRKAESKGGLFSKAKDFLFKKEEKAAPKAMEEKEEMECDDEDYEVFHEAKNAQFK